MSASGFNKSARQAIKEDLKQGLALLVGDVTPAADEARFDLYQGAVARAKNANCRLPDLPDCVAGACDRLLYDRRWGGPRAGMWLPDDVQIAYGHLKANPRQATANAPQVLTAYTPR